MYLYMYNCIIIPICAGALHFLTFIGVYGSLHSCLYVCVIHLSQVLLSVLTASYVTNIIASSHALTPLGVIGSNCPQLLRNI